MRFSLKEEETGRYRESVSRFLEQITQINRKLSESLVEVLQQTKYELLQKIIQQIVEEYNDRVAGIVTQKAYLQWRESGMDLRGYLAWYQVGEGAEETCEAVQKQIEELLGIGLQIELPAVSPPERPVISDVEFDRLEEIWNTYASEMKEVCEDFRTDISGKAEENEIYSSLNGLLRFIYEGFGQFPEEAKEKLNRLHEEVRERSRRLQSAAEEWSIAGKTEKRTDIGGLAETEADGKTFVERAVENSRAMAQSASGKEKILGGVKKAAVVAGAAAAGVLAGGAGLLVGAAAGGIAGAIFGAGLASAGAKGGMTDTQAVPAKNSGEEEKKGGKKEAAGEGSAQDRNSSSAQEDLTQEEYREKYREQILQVLIEIISPVGVDKLNQLAEQHKKLINDSLEIRMDQDEKVKKNVDDRKKQASKTDTDKKDKYPYGRYTVNADSIELMGKEAYETQLIMKPMERFYQKRYQSVESMKGYQTVKTVCHSLSGVLVKYFLNAYDFNKSVKENCASILLQKVISGSTTEIKDWKKDAVPLIQDGLKKLMPAIEENKILTKLNRTVLNTVNRFAVKSPLEGYMEAYILEKYEMKLDSGFKESGRYEYFHKALKQIKEEKDKEAVEYVIFAAEIIICCTDCYNWKISESQHRKRREAGTGIFLNLVRSGLADAGGLKADVANRYTDYLYEIYQKEEHITPETKRNPMERVIR